MFERVRQRVGKAGGKTLSRSLMYRGTKDALQLGPGAAEGVGRRSEKYHVLGAQYIKYIHRFTKVMHTVSCEVEIRTHTFRVSD